MAFDDGGAGGGGGVGEDANIKFTALCGLALLDWQGIGRIGMVNIVN